MVGRKRLDESVDPVADLKREVGGGRADQLPDVLDRRLALEALGVLELAHGAPNRIGHGSETFQKRLRTRAPGGRIPTSRGRWAGGLRSFRDFYISWRQLHARDEPHA